MGKHLDGIERILDPEVFKDFVERYGDILPMREEVADKFRDLNPGESESLWVEYTQPWIVNWVREQEVWNRRKYEELLLNENMDLFYRSPLTTELSERIIKERPSAEELITTKWLGYFSFPGLTIRADLAYPLNQVLYGKYATLILCLPDMWMGENLAVIGWHLENGIPASFWIVGVHKNMVNFITTDLADAIAGLVPRIAPEFSVPGMIFDPDSIPEVWSKGLERKHLRLGISIREMPKKRPFTAADWVLPVRDIIMDLREEEFPKWTHAMVYMINAPVFTGIGLLHNFWGTLGWLNEPWLGFRGRSILGWPMQQFMLWPAPPIIKSMMLSQSLENFKRQTGGMFMAGPKGMLCDVVSKLTTPEEHAPLIYDIRRSMFEKGKMYKDFAAPYDDGIPPPPALLTALPYPFYKEANISVFIENPNEISGEYWDLLESEGGVDKKTGRIPPYSEVPRLKWLFDPTIEWLKPKDFPPLDYEMGQVWPADITREKMEIMVEEGYDGSGKDILHYSSLADKKMGQQGKTIMLGTVPYELPTE